MCLIFSDILCVKGLNTVLAMISGKTGWLGAHSKYIETFIYSVSTLIVIDDLTSF